MKPKTDIWGKFAIWLWGKHTPVEIFKAQRFFRKSPLGEYIKYLETRIKHLEKESERLN